MRQENIAFNDHLALHILELWKFTKSAAELVTPLDPWLYCSLTVQEKLRQLPLDELERLALRWEAELNSFSRRPH